MYYFTGRLKKAILPVLLAFIILASPALAATYSATIHVTESSGNNYDMTSVILGWNTVHMVDNSIITATGLDTRVMAGSSQMPHLVADDKLVFASEILPFSNTPFEFLAGESALASYTMTFGRGGYAWVADNPIIEPGGNFTYSHSGWVDTGAGDNKNLLSKAYAIRTYVDDTVAGNVTSDIYSVGLSTEVLRPDGDNQCNLPNSTGGGCPNHWQEVDEVVVNDADWNGIWLAAGDATDNYTLQNTAISANATIVAVEMTIRGDNDNAGNFTGGLTLGANVTWGVVHAPVVFTTYSENLTRPGGGDWVVGDLNGLLYNARCQTGGGADSSVVSWCYITVYWAEVGARASVTGVTSGEHTITADGRPQSEMWATGDVLHFDGTALSNVNFGTIYDASPKFWMSMWFKLDADFGSAMPGDQYFWGKYFDANNGIWARFEKNTGGIQWIQVVGGAAQFTLTTDTRAWNGGEWYHLQFSCNQSIGGGSGSNGVRMLVNNGGLKTDADLNAMPNGGNLTLGLYEAVGSQRFEGVIANVIVGTDDLTTAEETALYNGTAPGDETDYWYVDEGGGITIYSWGSLANPGSANTSTTWTTSSYNGTDKTGRLCDFVLSVDENRRGLNAVSLKGVSVLNNANPWYFVENDVMPYCDNISASINGTAQLWYQPNDYIRGTVLPDRAGTSQNGTIVWGANPTGVVVTVGSLIPVGTYGAGAEEMVNPDAAPEISPPDLNPSDPTAEQGWAIFAPFMTAIAAMTNTPLEWTWEWLNSLITLILIVIMFRVTNNLWMAGLGGLVGIGIGMGMSVFAGWMLIVAIIMVIGISLLDRTSSL